MSEQNKVEETLNEIKSAVIEGKESTANEIKTLKDEIKEINEEVAEIKSGVVMPKNVEQKETIQDAKAKFWNMVKTGRDAEGYKLGSDLISESKGVTVLDDASAGAGVAQELSNDILTQLREDYTIIGDMNSYSVTSVDHYKMVQNGYTGTSWVGENTANTNRADDATFTLTRIAATFGKISSKVYATNESLTDPVFDVEGMLMKDIKTSIGRGLGQAVIDGDGVNKPKGILAHFDETESAVADETRDKDVFGHIEVSGGVLPTDSAAGIKLLRDLVLSVKTPYLAKSAFRMNRATFDWACGLVDGNGRPFLQYDLTGKAAGTILGYPIKIEDHLPSAGVGSYPILFGDMKQAMNFIDYTGLSMIQDPFTVKGNVQFYVEKRVGTMMGDNWALKAVKVVA